MNVKNLSNLAALGEMYPSRCSPNVMQSRPKGWPGVRAQVRLQSACATRPIEKTGDSSTPLRMTCVAISIGEPLSPHIRRDCHPEEAERPAKRPRTGSSSKGMCYTSNRVDGRFFAALRMTCVAITIGQPLSPHLRRNCHPEKAMPAGRRQAVRPFDNTSTFRQAQCRQAQGPARARAVREPPLQKKIRASLTASGTR